MRTKQIFLSTPTMHGEEQKFIQEAFGLCAKVLIIFADIIIKVKKKVDIYG